MDSISTVHLSELEFASNQTPKADNHVHYDILFVVIRVMCIDAANAALAILLKLA